MARDSITPVLDPTILMVKVPEAGRRMGIATTKAWDLVLTGELPSVKLGGRRYVRVADLLAFVEALAVSSFDAGES